MLSCHELEAGALKEIEIDPCFLHAPTAKELAELGLEKEEELPRESQHRKLGGEETKVVPS